MTAAVVRRGSGKPSPRSAARNRASTGNGKAKKKTASALARVVDRIPLTTTAWERIATGLMLFLVAAGLVVAAVLAGVPAMIGTQIDRGVAGAGFVVKRVDVTGVKRMDRLTVYAVAIDQRSRAMSEIDLDAIRAGLLRYGWIKDARVSRRLPDTLVIDIVEREPAAVWQHGGKLTLIDRDGVRLAPVRAEAMPDLPLLIGGAANGQASALSALLDHGGRLKPILQGATWVGNRRWDLKFQSGETLALPEGKASASRALARFEAMDAQERLLGRGFIRFDMRDPARMFVRVDRGKATIDMLPQGAEPAPKSEGDVA